MEFFTSVIDFFLHINLYLGDLVATYHQWVYLILFLVIFCETGLIFFPFLPGDSLLFAAGSLAALGGMNVHVLAILLVIAAIAGDAVNYAMGKIVGPKVFNRPKSRFFNPDHLHTAQSFYERYGNKTIVFARFIPIVRTFAPFVAGIGKMPYRQFFQFNVLGAVIWVYGLLYLSYFFGSIAWIQQHFSWVILGIIFFSLVPVVVKIAQNRFENHKP